MPEPPEVHVLKERIRRVDRYNPGQNFRLQIIPQCFGEEVKPLSCGVNRELYVDSCEQLDSSYRANEHDLARSTGQAWEYLLKNLISGPLVTEVKGKQIVIACGYHAVTVHLGLEASIVGFPTPVFDEILAQGSVPGPNKDKDKAERLRSFNIPAKYIEENSSPNKNRRVSIQVAWISDPYVWALLDFSRFTRITITSHKAIWGQDDLTPGSPYWDSLWIAYNNGPDWVLETEAAVAQLDNWRSNVLNKPTKTAIANCMSGNKIPAFVSFGKHTLHDFLHDQELFPGTPAFDICYSNKKYEKFKQGCVDYMGTWTSSKFLAGCSGIPNSSNPFAYNYKSEKYYLGTYLKVFRRKQVWVPREQYNRMLLAGLLDPQHIVGRKYRLQDQTLLCSPNHAHKLVQVFYRRAPLDCYTIIRAQAPQGWCDGVEETAADVLDAGYHTAIGPAEFREQKWNKVNLKLVTNGDLKGKPGRKRKLPQSGFPGRPRKQPRISELRRLAAQRMAQEPEDAGKVTVQPKSRKEERMKKL